VGAAHPGRRSSIDVSSRFASALADAVTGYRVPPDALELLEAVLVVELAAADDGSGDGSDDLEGEIAPLLEVVDRAVASGAVPGRHRLCLASPPTLDAVATVAFAELGFSAAEATRLRRVVRDCASASEPEEMWSSLGYAALEVTLAIDDATFSRLSEAQCRRLVAIVASSRELAAADASELATVLHGGEDLEAQVRTLERKLAETRERPRSRPSDELGELLEARRLVEVHVAGRAAERRDAEQLGAMDHHLGKMRSGTSAVDLVDADIGFHLAVAAASGNGVLGRMLTEHLTLLRPRVVRAVESSGGRFAPSYRDHVPIFHAVEHGDAEAAERAMSDHLEMVARRLLAART